jgi:hypothetical protein
VHAPWELARYNHIRPLELTQLRAPNAGFVDPAGRLLPNPAVLPPPLLWAPGFGQPRVFGLLPDAAAMQSFADVVLTPEIWERFQSGIDIPGEGFQTVDDAAMQTWLNSGVRPTPQAPVLLAWAARPTRFGWQWRFGYNPMGFPGNALPQRTLEKGKQMLEDPYVEFERDKWRVRPDETW